MTEMVLEQVEMFDKKVASPRTVTEQLPYGIQSGGIDLPSFRRCSGTSAPAAGMPMILHNARIRPLIANTHCLRTTRFGGFDLRPLHSKRVVASSKHDRQFGIHYTGCDCHASWAREYTHSGCNN